MRQRLILLAALLRTVGFATSAAAASPPGYLPPLAGPEGPVRVQFEGLLHTGKSLPGGAHFSAATLRDLLILVEYRQLDGGPHTQRLKLFLPDGALYQQFTTEFGTPPEGGDRGKGRRGPGWEQVETRLPVGGTWITEFGLYGTWRVEVYLNQARTPAAQRTLVLSQ